MNWYETLIWVIGGLGGVGGIFSIYTARVQKKKIQVEVTQLLNDEWKELFDTMKANTNERINSLESKINKLEIKDEIKNRAINQVIKCSYPDQTNICPIVSYIEKVSDCLEGNVIKNKF